MTAARRTGRPVVTMTGDPPSLSDELAAFVQRGQAAQNAVTFEIATAELRKLGITLFRNCPANIASILPTPTTRPRAPSKPWTRQLPPAALWPQSEPRPTPLKARPATPATATHDPESLQQTPAPGSYAQASRARPSGTAPGRYWLRRQSRLEMARPSPSRNCRQRLLLIGGLKQSASSHGQVLQIISSTTRRPGRQVSLMFR